MHGENATISVDRALDLRSRTRDAALYELVESFCGDTDVGDRERLLEALIDREEIESTGIGHGVAVPHAKLPSVRDFAVVYARSATGIDWRAFDDAPVHHVVLIVGPPDRQRRYLQLLASAVQGLRRAELRTRLLESDIECAQGLLRGDPTDDDTTGSNDS